MKNEHGLPGTAEGSVAPATERAAGDSLVSPEELETLCAQLADALTNPAFGSHMLRQQAQLLDRLLYSVMTRKTQADLACGHASDDWIRLVLQIQKQCMDTVKAIGAVEYMKAITPAMRALPPAPGTGERTIKES